MHPFVRLVIAALLAGPWQAGEWVVSTGTAPIVRGSLPPAQATSPSSSAPGRPSQGAVFRTEVDYVEVDAFVTDERGNVVHDLARDDFQIFEEGTRQEVAAFARVEVPIERVGATPIEGLPPPRDVATNEEGVRGRIYAIVLDELHTDARRSGLLRQLAGRFIEQHMAANDVAAIVFTSGRTDAAQAFTGNKRLLQEAVARFTGRKLRSATLERLSAIEQQRDLLLSEARPGDAAPAPEAALARGVSPEGWHELEVKVKRRRATVRARAGYVAGR